jgi:serine/threonine protein kinase
MQERSVADDDVTRADVGGAAAGPSRSSLESSGEGPAEAPIVPGYDVLRVLGRGGMGVVWEAIDHRLERRVALKVHSGGPTPERVAQLWVEAKLAARIAHPGVVSVHDVGKTLDGRPYYTMDLVEGTSLTTTLRDGPFPQTRALAVAAEIADAVAAAHDRGIIHCDLKPSNVLLDPQGRVKILDFGLAERLDDQRARLEIRGSPPYMSPEQISAQVPSIASDLYSIGVILYEMLAGRRPFVAASLDELLLTIVSDPPPPLSEHTPNMSSDVERVCLRCLEKRPEDRFLSARALHETLSAILEGRPIGELGPGERPYAPRPLSVIPQRTKPVRDDARYHFRFSYVVAATPERIWPFVANTDRFNKAVGLPEVEFADTKNKDGYWVRTGRLRVLGTHLFWDEHPFEWVRHREHSVFRSYRLGPLKGLWNQVTLVPRDDGKTELIHEIWAKPNGVFGRVAVLVELKLKTTRRIDKFYRRLAAALSEGETPVEFFEEPHRPSKTVRERVEKAAAYLTDDRHFPAPLVQQLTGLILFGPSKRVERLRPFALADTWKARREEVLDLFLHAANAGLVDIAWDLICPECRTPHEAAASLQKVVRMGSCTACGTAYERDLAKSVELVFRPHRSLRTVLPTTYCAGAPGLRPHVFVQQILDPGERRTVVVELERGDYRLVASRATKVWEFSASVAGVSSACSVRLFADTIEARPLVVRAGEVTFELENGTSGEEIFRLEIAGSSTEDVTAAMAISHPSFHEFFSEELVAHGDHLSVSRMAFVFVDVDDRAGYFDQHGDSAALGLLSKLEAQVQKQAEEHQGSLVQVDSARGLLVAAFSDAADALDAAIAVLPGSLLAAPGARVRMSVHQGRCIALTRESSIQYFGETLERGASLLTTCDPGAIAVSTAISDDRDAARRLFAADVEREVSVVSSGRYKGRRFTMLRPRA